MCFTVPRPTSIVFAFRSTTRIMRPGLPTTIVLGETSFVTTLPAPTIAFSPMVTLARIVAPDPIDARFYDSRFDLPVLLRLQRPVGRSGARIKIVNEHHAVAPIKTLSSMATPFTNKRMAGNFAVLANGSILLDINKGADLGAVTDLATI